MVAWKPLADKKLADFDVPRDPEDRIDKKGGVEAVHNMQVATRVATTVKNLLPAVRTHNRVLMTHTHTHRTPCTQRAQRSHSTRCVPLRVEGTCALSWSLTAWS